MVKSFLVEKEKYQVRLTLGTQISLSLLFLGVRRFYTCE